MHSKEIRAYYIIVLIGICICFLSFFMIKSKEFVYYADNKVYNLSSSMTVEKGEDFIIYKGQMPQKYVSDKSIVFYTSHMDVRVRVGSKVVYSYNADPEGIIKTTGYVWNTIYLKEEYEGQPFSIILKSCYGDEPYETTVYYGRYYSIVRRIIKDGIFIFSFAVLILIMGIVLMSYSAFLLKTKKADYALTHLSVFTLMLGIWVLGDTKIYALICTNSVFCSIITHMGLMFVTAPFVMFLKYFFMNDSLIVKWYLRFDCSVAAIRIFLQATGIFEFKQTIFLTHICIVVFVLVALFLCIKEVICKQLTLGLRIEVLCLMLIAISSVIELFNYKYISNNVNALVVMLVMYLCVMAFVAVKRSRKIFEKASEIEIYRKLAYTDELTGLYNRNAFMNDTQNYKLVDDESGEKCISPVSIIMCDLNDLKKCNDEYGHEYGDKYITMIASEMEKAFGLQGRCYRIGGDEFCVILPIDKESYIRGMIEKYKTSVEALNKTPFVVRIQVAVGYAIYDKEIDKNLEDTRNRADKQMYFDKSEQKRNIINQK